MTEMTRVVLLAQKLASCLWLTITLVIMIGAQAGLGKASENSNQQTHPTITTGDGRTFTWDTNGYIIFCPCMGRFGNQADHFLGALGFAKSLDRTLVLPPWRSYKNVPFSEWFKVEPLAEFHKVTLAEDFMEHLAPTYWPPGKRSGWCWLPSGSKEKCRMKEGNPFGPFWDGLGVDFDDYVIYNIGYDSYEKNSWKSMYPPSKYPVMAFKGAPASFPVIKEHVSLQRYLQWSDSLEQEAQNYIDQHFKGKSFLGLHLRNGVDWRNACTHIDGMRQFMASPQCMGYNGGGVTDKICFPADEDVLQQVKKAVIRTKVEVIFVATDQSPMTKQLTSHLKDQKVEVFHMDPWLPQLDLIILGKADHFIGNCVSSFTAFVKRERDVKKKSSEFFGVDKIYQ